MSLGSVRSIYQHRKQRGVNLGQCQLEPAVHMITPHHPNPDAGSWFVLERWITPTPFRNAVAPGASDLQVAKGYDAKAILELYWNSRAVG